MEITIKDILRTGHVTRWQIVRTARQQTLAEHLYLVTMLSLEIAELINLGPLPDNEKIKLMNWSLNHDVPEVITGDVATPMKKMIKSKCNEDPFDILDRQMYEVYGDAKDAISGTYIEAVVKLADIMDGIVFLSTEGMGDHASYVRSCLVNTLGRNIQVAKAKWPIHDWLSILDLLGNLAQNNNVSQIEFENLHRG